MSICNQCIAANRVDRKTTNRDAFIKGLVYGIVGTFALLACIGGCYV